MHYVIGDVHGCYDEMMRVLAKIEAKDPEAVIYFLGDFIDRGPEVWKVLTWAMEHITPDGKYRSVRGNHEDMIREWYEDWKLWYECAKGTDREAEWEEPKTKYDFYDRLKERDMLTPKKLEPILNFICSLPNNRRVVVTSPMGKEMIYRIAHAWHYQYENISLEDQRYANLWERNLCGNTNSGEVIAHGHTPNLPDTYYMVSAEDAGKICYEERSNSINVDGGCCYQEYMPDVPCMLCGICLETLEEFYPCTLEERFNEFKEKGYLLPDSKIEDFPAFVPVKK